LWEKCSCPSCGQIFKNNNFHKDNNQEKIQNNRNGLGHKKSSFVLTANAVKTYRGLFENLKMEIPLNSKEIEIILDEKNINPSSEYINFLADYSYSYSLKSLPIAPVYVRDFIAFSKK
ncbi:MAG: hypothetical protein ACYCXO_05465, partial [Candidatus Humimicrobiaceae bacterium]